LTGTHAEEIISALNTMQVCPFCVSLIRVGLEINEGYFRAATAAKFTEVKMFNFPDLIQHPFAGEPLSSVPAAAVGAIHDITAPLKIAPILGDILDKDEKGTEANVEMNPIDSRVESVEPPDGEVGSAPPVEVTPEDTNQTAENG